jgi:hypothetical protein
MGAGARVFTVAVESSVPVRTIASCTAALAAMAMTMDTTTKVPFAITAPTSTLRVWRSIFLGIHVSDSSDGLLVV